MGQLLTHIVQRSFGDDTISELDPLQHRQAGECVNAMCWRTTGGLERNRHITLMPEGLGPVADTFGRYWVDLEMLRKSGREPLEAELAQDKPVPVIVPSQPSDDLTWLFDLDPDADDLDFNVLVEHGFPMPVKTSERRWQLWDGQVVVGSMTEAGEEHFAGVRARLRELRAEHLVPAAGSVTDI